MGDKKRREPESVPPIEIGGVRYEAPFSGAAYGFQQDGGIVIARDAASGCLDWAQKIYHIDYDDNMEDDKQDIFISKMRMSEDASALVIENEHGVFYRLNLADRSVVEIEPSKA